MKQADLSILVPTAGMGQRLGLGPKAALKLDGQTLLSHVLGKARQLSQDVVIGLPPSLSATDLAPAYARDPCCRFVQGGQTRRHTLQSLLALSHATWVLVWDVSRPLASLSLVQRVLAAAYSQQHRPAVTSQPTDMPVCLPAIEAELGQLQASQIVSQAQALLLQTPLASSRTQLAHALDLGSEQMPQASLAELYTQAGYELQLVNGEIQNIKITQLHDLYAAQCIMEQYSVTAQTSPSVTQQHLTEAGGDE
jgi:2-C-methyl-D-erythritol 4-phosphate cytidylyltransferase